MAALLLKKLLLSLFSLN